MLTQTQLEFGLPRHMLSWVSLDPCWVELGWAHIESSDLGHVKLSLVGTRLSLVFPSSKRELAQIHIDPIRPDPNLFKWAWIQI